MSYEQTQKTDSPLISVIVAIYNISGYLRQCLDSLVSQTMYSSEFILIDDGSTDDSGLICDEFAAKDSRMN